MVVDSSVKISGGQHFGWTQANFQKNDNIFAIP
jgi:hypothetical protein